MLKKVKLYNEYIKPINLNFINNEENIFCSDMVVLYIAAGVFTTAKTGVDRRLRRE
jgi:hypothetical protein